MAEKLSTTEDSFRESLKDVATVLDRLQGHYTDVSSVLATVQLALENEVHLQLLMSVVLKKR